MSPVPKINICYDFATTYFVVFTFKTFFLDHFLQATVAAVITFYKVR